MTLYVVTVYHNAECRFLPYEPGHRLTQVISHWRYLFPGIAPEAFADWIYGVFNADLDQLERGRAAAEGEANFLIACTYRLLRLRSLSTGDVIAVTVNNDTIWLACEPVSWRRIATPANISDQVFTAQTVYHRARSGRHA